MGGWGIAFRAKERLHGTPIRKYSMPLMKMHFGRKS